MTGGEQQIIEFEQKIQELKNEYMSEISKWIKIDQSGEADTAKIDQLARTHRAALNYFNARESFVKNSSLLGAHDNDVWVIDLAEECHSSLKSFLKYYIFYNQARAKYELTRWVLDDTAYASMQRMVAVCLQPLSCDVCDQYYEAGLPVHGFKYPAIRARNKEMLPTKWIVTGISIGIFLVLLMAGLATWSTNPTVPAIVFGTAFVLIILAFVLGVPNPTNFQMYVLRVVLSVAAAAAGAIIPGFLSIKGNAPGFAIRAGGALALFVIIYLISPPAFSAKAKPPAKRPMK